MTAIINSRRFKAEALRLSKTPEANAAAIEFILADVDFDLESDEGIMAASELFEDLNIAVTYMGAAARSIILAHDAIIARDLISLTPIQVTQIHSSVDDYVARTGVPLLPLVYSDIAEIIELTNSLTDPIPNSLAVIREATRYLDK